MAAPTSTSKLAGELPRRAAEPADAADAAEPEPLTPAEARLRVMVGRTLRVQVVDGRLFEGRFSCFDQQRNVVLAGAQESNPNSAASGEAAGA